MKFRYVMLFAILLPCVYSCKKEKTPPPTVTIVGKWLTIKQASQLFYKGVKVDSVNRTKFTAADFVEYYNDGSGYYSKSTPSGISLSEFTYSVAGTTLTQYFNAQNKGIPGTITNLTASTLSLHLVYLTQDPNDPTVTDTEIDDYTYSR